MPRFLREPTKLFRSRAVGLETVKYAGHRWRLVRISTARTFAYIERGPIDSPEAKWVPLGVLKPPGRES